MTAEPSLILKSYFFLPSNPSKPDKIITVDKKHVSTPINMAIPRLTNPGQMEKTRDPNANIVVALVRRIAFPVLAKT